MAAFGLWWLLAFSAPALALSELQQEDLEPPPDPETTIEREPLPPPPDFTIPLPDPIRPPIDIDDTRFGELPVEPDQLPEVKYDLDLLPEAARTTRAALMDIARSGDIEQLLPYIGTGSEATQFSLGPTPDDPIAYLRSISGDQDGHEILAILYEVLDAGFVHLDNGDTEEMYVWPYFFALPLEGLDPRQRVELFKLVTAGDYEDMKAYGGYIFYRTGITPEGRWAFFLAGH